MAWVAILGSRAKGITGTSVEIVYTNGQQKISRSYASALENAAVISIAQAEVTALEQRESATDNLTFKDGDQIWP